MSKKQISFFLKLYKQPKSKLLFVDFSYFVKINKKNTYI